MTNYEKVKAFMEAFGQAVPARATMPDEETMQLRLKLIAEEVSEFAESVQENDIVNAAKELADILYVVYGAGLAMGINLDQVFHDVHNSNMSKLGADGKPVYREDGKVIKGPNYEKPNLLWVIE
jgi:predicted HAD superfamily Cof-like phosphohydrolase